MLNTPKDPLFDLIKSLTKSEKRNFKLFARRLQSGESAKFMLLFDALGKQKVYEEAKILKRLPQIKRSQLSNLKAHLNKQLLISLRLQHTPNNIDMQIRERMDYAKILYNKGLYKQSLKELDRVKQVALDTEEYLLCYEIIEFEKLIESQYITRSIKSRSDDLVKQAVTLSHKTIRIHQLSNLALKLYGWYINIGSVRNKEDRAKVKTFFHTNLPSNLSEQQLGFREQLHLYRSYVWYYLITHNVVMQYRYAQKWVDLFAAYPHMMTKEPFHYLKGVNNLLLALSYLNHYPKFVQTLDLLDAFRNNKKGKLNENTEIQLFLFSHTHNINKHFLQGTFSDALYLIPEIEQGIQHYGNKLDPHRILVFYFKIAAIYFGSSEYENAILYLNKIIDYKDTKLREDIHCFARILNLVAHYELGNMTLVEYQIRSVYRFLIKMNDLHVVQKEILKFLRKLPSLLPKHIKNAFQNLLETLQQHADEPYERRAFFYFDIISWLKGKIEGTNIQTVMHRKFLERHG